MKNSFFNKRIPTLLGLSIIVVGILMTSFLVNQGVITIGNASPSEVPTDVRISNITDTSFTVSYTTTAKVLGSLRYGKDTTFGTTVFDDRDQLSGNAHPDTLHYITVHNVSPNTRYFFSLTSGEKSYVQTNNQPFQVNTGTVITQEPPQQTPVTGKVITTQGSPAESILVYLSASPTQTISTLTKSDGSYIFPLNSLRTNDLLNYASISSEIVFHMLFIGADEKSAATLLAKQTSPAPTITLSSNYDFSLVDTPVASSSAQVSFPAFNATPSSSLSPEIVVPKKGEGIPDQQPVFKGKASPNSDVQILIHSTQTVKTTIITDQFGNWSYRPPTKLDPGEHTISITTRDAAGILKKIEQSFTVYAEGSQVNQSATPSATLTPLPSPTTKPTPTSTPKPAIIAATPTVQPTAIPTAALLLSPTPFVTQMIFPTVSSAPPPSPGSNESLLIGAAAIVTTTIGVLLFILTRRAAL